MSVFVGLRLALVGPLPPPAGGMAMQTRQLAELLREQGAEVTIVQSNAPCWPRWIERIRIVRAAFRLAGHAVRSWRAAGACQLFHVMANSGWSWHLVAATAIRIARWRGVPVVVNYRGGEAESFLEMAHLSIRRTLTGASIVAVPSGFLKKIFAVHGIDAEVVPNIVDTGLFAPLARARSRGAHLVVVRNLEPLYDNATALRALARIRERIPTASMTVAGSGPELAYLRALARQLGIDDAVTFAGRLEREEVADLYRRADIMLNPSTVDNSPNSVLEALSCGVPVVSTDVGGVPYLVQHGRTALLVPPRDPVAMADAALALLEDDVKAQALATAGLTEARRYTWGAVAPVLADTYARALAMTWRRAF